MAALVQCWTVRADVLSMIRTKLIFSAFPMHLVMGTRMNRLRLEMYIEDDIAVATQSNYSNSVNEATSMFNKSHFSLRRRGSCLFTCLYRR